MSLIKMSRQSFTMLLVWALVCVVWMQPVVAATPEAAGQVIVASGTVQALTSTGEQRILRRRSSFYTGEIIRTAAASEVQLRFSDGALMSLRAGSELRVDEYRFQNQGGTGDRSMTTLIKGGLRTITGVIGKQDPASYQLSTPVATIGVRGTHYEAVLESSKSLVLAAWQGGIRVRNEQGIIDLGKGADYNFARAEAGQSPNGLLEPPAVLHNETPVGHAQPAGQAAAAQDESTTQENAQTDSETPSSAETETDATTQKPEGTDGEGDFSTTDVGVGTEPMAESAVGESFTSPIGSPIADSPCSTCAPPQQIVITEPTDLPPLPDLLPDLRFTASEWNSLQTTPYLGLWIEVNNTPDFGFDGGRALYHGTDSPVLTENGYGPHEPQYTTAPILDVVRRGKASVDAFGSYKVDATHTVYWGTWNGSINPVEIQIDPTDGSIKELSYAPLHWATMVPTEPAAIAARTGTVSYNTVIVAHGGGSGGGPLTPGNVMFNANVNFDTGAVTNGNLNIYNGPEAWNMNFTGQVRGNVLDIPKQNLMGSVAASPNPPRPVEGDIGMAFTGNQGQALGGGFSFQEIGNPARHVEGILLVK